NQPPLMLEALMRQSSSVDAANKAVAGQMERLRQLAIELGALGNLAERFPASVRDNLQSHARSQLDKVASARLIAARNAWAAIVQTDTPFLSVINPLPAAAATLVCGSWDRPLFAPADAAWRLEAIYARAFTTLASLAPSDITQQTIREESGR